MFYQQIDAVFSLHTTRLANSLPNQRVWWLWGEASRRPHFCNHFLSRPASKSLRLFRSDGLGEKRSHPPFSLKNQLLSPPSPPRLYFCLGLLLLLHHPRSSLPRLLAISDFPRSSYSSSPFLHAIKSPKRRRRDDVNFHLLPSCGGPGWGISKTFLVLLSYTGISDMKGVVIPALYFHLKHTLPLRCPKRM